MITDPVAIKFANERVRAFAEREAKLYYEAKQLVNDWDARSMAAVLVPGDATKLDDGSFIDGRPHISADDCYAVILRASELVTGLEANNKATLTSILKVAVHPNP